MALGAAGCGLEYGSTTRGTCPMLIAKNHPEFPKWAEGKEFACIRYYNGMEVQNPTGHPIRLKECSDKV